jgi:hypothetical protein
VTWSGLAINAIFIRAMDMKPQPISYLRIIIIIVMVVIIMEKIADGSCPLLIIVIVFSP